MTTHNDSGSPFKLLLNPGKAALAIGRRNTLTVLVRIHAPHKPEAPGDAARAPLHLALVLDRSGSMNGQPLEEAKRCARHMVDSLGPDDQAAIFAFDDTVERVASLTPASRKLSLAAALTSIGSGGSTNLHGGWLGGAEELAAKLAGDDVHRVILLSDGCANAGETDLERITGQCKSFARKGVSTSTYGLGRNFNEDLMLAMASAGQGNAYYGQTAADLAEPFAAEFALLTSLAARGLVLKVKVPDGVVVRLRNDYEPVEDEPLAWKLPDLAFASEAWALLEVDLPASEDDKADLPIIFTVQASTADSSPLFLIAGLPALALVPSGTFDAMPCDEAVARRTMELDAADALLAVRAAVTVEDWVTARRLVNEAFDRFAAHPWAVAVLATMRRLIAAEDKPLASKEAAFARRSLNVRLSMPDEGSFDAASECDIPAFLRRKGEQGRGERGGDASSKGGDGGSVPRG